VHQPSSPYWSCYPKVRTATSYGVRIRDPEYRISTVSPDSRFPIPDSRTEMPHHCLVQRHFHRIALPRLLTIRPRHATPGARAAHKRAFKRATLRDCSRRCVYCGTALDLQTATLDHVQPLARGGAHTPGNVVAACGPCNRRKGDMPPQEFFARYPNAGLNFLMYARIVHRALKRSARRAVSLSMAA
jgi:5-methylcytosine-specific restriction endonuclease McrA